MKKTLLFSLFTSVGLLSMQNAYALDFGSFDDMSKELTCKKEHYKNIGFKNNEQFVFLGPGICALASINQVHVLTALSTKSEFLTPIKDSDCVIKIIENGDDKTFVGQSYTINHLEKNQRFSELKGKKKNNNLEPIVYLQDMDEVKKGDVSGPGQVFSLCISNENIKQGSPYYYSSIAIRLDQSALSGKTNTSTDNTFGLSFDNTNTVSTSITEGEDPVFSLSEGLISSLIEFTSGSENSSSDSSFDESLDLNDTFDMPSSSENEDFLPDDRMQEFDFLK